MNIRLLLLAVLVTCAPTASALRAERPISESIVDQWVDRDGLQQTTVTSMAQGDKGYLWLGTNSGVSRFDGRKFQVFELKDNPAFLTSEINALAAEPGGGVMVGTSRGIVRIRDGRSTVVPVSGSTLGDKINVQAFSRCPDGSLWATSTEGVLRSTMRGFQRLADGPQNVGSLACTQNGVWVGGEGRIHHHDLHQWTHDIALPATRQHVLVNAVVYRDDVLWAGTTKGLLVRRNQKWSEVSGGQLRTDDNISFLTFDRNGLLWVAGSNGVTRVRADGTVLDSWTQTGSRGITQARAVLEDRDGAIWVGTQLNGLFKLSPPVVSRISLPSSSVTPTSWSLTPVHGSRDLWVGADTGVFRVTPAGVATLKVAANSLPHPHAYNIFSDDDRLWIGTRTGLVYIDNAARPGLGRIVHDPALAPLRLLQINGFLRMPDGALLVATTGGVFAYANGELRNVSAGLPPGTSVFYLSRMRDGQIVVGTNGGAYLRKGNAPFEPIVLGKAVPPEVSAVVELPDGTRLFGCLDGTLYTWKNGQVRQFPQNAPLDSNHVFFLGVLDNDLWLSGIRGISHTPLREVQAFASDAKAPVPVFRAVTSAPRFAHGFDQGDCCNGLGTSKGLIADGKIWAPGGAGIVYFDPKSPQARRAAPIPAIERVRVSGKWTATAFAPKGELPRGARDLTFEFTLVVLHDAPQSRVRYRLRGYEAAWRNATFEERRVQYTNIPPGDYVFEVTGETSDGQVPDAPATYAFSVPPYFRETVWLWVVVGASALLFTLGLIFWLNRTARRRETELNRLVESRTRELAAANEELERASVTDVLTGAHNRRYVSKQLPADMAYYTRHILLPGHTTDAVVFCLIDIDHFKQVNDTHGHDTGDIVLTEVANRLQHLVRKGDYVVRWGGEEFLVVYRPMPDLHAGQMAERLCDAIRSVPFKINDSLSLHITCSIGMAQFPLQNADWETLVVLADRALYFTKEHGRNGWALLTPARVNDEAATRALVEAPQQEIDAGRAAYRFDIKGL